MLQLGTGMQTVEGITCFPDHSDPKQWWYLPKDVRIARREDGHPLFSLLKFRRDPSDPVDATAGFAIFTVTLALSPEQERRVAAKLPGGDVRLTSVPFDEGSVKCVALNLQGPGGAVAQVAANGSFTMVQSIQGATTPSLSGGCDALFSLSLSREGVTLLERAFEQGHAPIGVIYEVKYTALRPALDVKISADLERVYQQFSLGASVNVYYVKAAIDAGFERLVQQGAIKFEVTNFSTTADKADKEKWALDFFKDKLLTEWFEPTLTPGSFQGAGAGGGIPLPNAPKPASPLKAAEPKAPEPKTPEPKTPEPKTPEPKTPEPKTPEPKTPEPAKPTATKPTQSTPAPDEGGDGGSLITVRLKAIATEERKKITVEYHSSEATQRIHAPQANFGLLAEDLDRSDVIAEIPLSDPFFKKLEVEAEAPIDFAKIGLGSVTAALEYGDPTDAARHSFADLRFTAADPAAKRFSTFLDAAHTLSYDARVEFRFDPQSGWHGERDEYVVELPDSVDRTLLLDPYAHLGFVEVKVFPNRIDAGAVQWTDVQLALTEPSGWTARDTLTVVAGGEPQVWRVRTSAPEHREFQYTLVHHLADGTERVVGPIRSRASSLPVDDPFRSRIEPRFFFQLPDGAFSSALLEVTYTDGDYEREEEVEVNGDLLTPARVRIATLDPKKRDYAVRATLIGADRRIVRGPRTVTDADIVGINERAEVV